MMGLDVGTVNAKWTPAVAAQTIKDSERAPASGAFSYSSVVRMLLYLSGHTCPDMFCLKSCMRRL